MRDAQAPEVRRERGPDVRGGIVLHVEQLVQLTERMPPTATFYFDLGSPYAYLAAERIDAVLGPETIWQPVSLGALFKLTGRSSWALGDPRRRQAGMAEIERRARDCGLPPIRWPDLWPSHYLVAMRAATFAYEAGAGRAFTMAAFRLAFVEGHDLAIPAHVWEAARRAGLDPAEVEAATQDPAVKDALRSATAKAHERGVFGVPTVAVDGELFWGDDRLEDAAAHLDQARAA
jgi:2-hydroxychromene-2-carboxylate isomerase